MTPFETWCLLLAVFLAVLAIGKVLTIPSFVITKKKEPPAVRVSPELLAQMRSELIHDASKRVLRADFQRRGNGR